MRVLLPPSETKRSGGGNSFLCLEELSFASELTETRVAVKMALEELSNNQEEAVKALKLGARSAKEASLNQVLEESPVMPAIERYTGVLYDALGADTLEPGAVAWLQENVYVQSALFGLVSAKDEIPAYRLSASTSLTKQGLSLKKVWKEAHARIWKNDELVIDMRSKDYVSLAPNGDAFYLEVVARDETGIVRALNHFNKAAKGEFVRLLAEKQFVTETVAELIDFAQQNGIELLQTENQLTLVTHR